MDEYGSDEYKVFIADGARSTELSLNRWAEKGYILRKIITINDQTACVMVKWGRKVFVEESL